MQNDVIFGILMTILNKKIVTRQSLAEKYEISTRTVLRYVDVLASSGIPIISSRGKNGGYSIPDDYKLDKNFFKADEYRRLITSLKATASTFEDNINNMLIEKLQNLKNVADDEKYLVMTEKLIIDTGNWNNPTKFRNKISTINKAIENQNTIKLIYVDKNDYKSEREFAPYSLVLKEGIWYTIGKCYLRNEFRLFKLARIEKMIITENTFNRENIDLYGKLNVDLKNFDKINLILTFEEKVRSDIEEWLGSDIIIKKGETYFVNTEVYGGNLLIRKLLSFGSGIKVISPDIVKEELLVECKRIINANTY